MWPSEKKFRALKRSSDDDVDGITKRLKLAAIVTDVKRSRSDTSTLQSKRARSVPELDTVLNDMKNTLKCAFQHRVKCKLEKEALVGDKIVDLQIMLQPHNACQVLVSVSIRGECERREVLSGIGQIDALLEGFSRQIYNEK